MQLPASLRTLGIAAALVGLPPLACIAQAPAAPPPAQMNAIHSAPGYLGVDLRDVDEARAQELKLKEARGAEVVALDHDAPACKAGLREKDVIVSLDGQEIANADQLRRLMREMPAGKPVTVAVDRQGKPMNFKLQLADRGLLARRSWEKHYKVPMSDGQPMPGSFFSHHMPVDPDLMPSGQGHMHMGVMVQSMGPQLADYFGAKPGKGLLIQSVETNSPAEKAGLKAGDVLLKANGNDLANPMDLIGVLHENEGKPIQLTVLRNHREQTMSVTVEAPNNDSELQPFAYPVSDGAIGIKPEDWQKMQQEIEESRKQIAALDWDQVQAATDEARRSVDAMDLSAIRNQMEDPQHTMSTIDMPALQKQMDDAQRMFQKELQGLNLNGMPGTFAF